MTKKHIAEHEERQVQKDRIAKEGNSESHQAGSPAYRSDDGRTDDDNPIAMRKFVRKNIDQVEDDIDAEQAIEEPQCTKRIFAVVECCGKLRPFERLPIDAQPIIDQAWSETRNKEIEKEERNKQLVGLAFHEIPKSPVCLEEASRQEIV